MSIYKDWVKDNSGTTLSYKIKSFFNLKKWLELHKWRNQRADRGWSDRDAWSTGEHIAKMTADMLKFLEDEKNDDWIELNLKEDGNYNSLQPVIDDINNYLEYQKTGWCDDLYVMIDKDGHHHWVKEVTGKQLTGKQITARIKKYRDKDYILHDKAVKAMTYFGRNFIKF